jgi:hypothetical protein
MKRLLVASALLCVALRAVRGQEKSSALSTLLWGSACNKSLSFTVGSSQRGALLVAGFAGTIGLRDQTAMVGAGATFHSGGTGTRVLLETLLGTAGWTGRLEVATVSTVGEGSVFGRVDLSYPLRSSSARPSVDGLTMLFGRLRPQLRWGAAYQFTGEPGRMAQQSIGPGLEARIPHWVFIVAYGRGLGRSSDVGSVRWRWTR